MGYNPDLKCIKCFKRSSFIYYCEDCSGTFCRDCLVSEKTDCTFCKNCSHISIGNKCEKCGRLNHLPVARRVDKCPMCSSPKLKDMTKKIGGLPTEFYEYVEIIGQGLDSIQHFAQKFSEIVSNVKQVRRERYGLYPSVESGLMHIQKLFFETKQRASDLLDRVYEYIIRDARNLNFSRSLSIHQLTQIDKAVKVIKTHATSYANLIDDFLAKPKKELLDIEGKVAELKNYSYLFDEALEKFETEVYELKIAAFPNVKLKLPRDKRRKKGTLFITNKKLYFIPQHKIIFKFLGKVKTVPISSIKDLDLKSNLLLGNRMMLSLTERNRIKIIGAKTVLNKLKIIFSNLFHEREDFIISDPYLMEGFSTNLNFSALQEKTDKRIKDLKQAPFTKMQPTSIFDGEPRKTNSIPRESEQIKGIRIELKAVQDTMTELIKAFENRNITPDIYFSRREKTKQKILTLEGRLKDAQKSRVGIERLSELINYYSNEQRNEYPRR